MLEYIKRNYHSLVDEVENISSRSGVAVPKIVAVTKSGTDEELVALVRAGAYAIGENRPTELVRRGTLLSGLGLSCELHQIGTLQSNKAKLVAPVATAVHSLASLSLAEELSKRCVSLGKVMPVLIEINSASEPQKDGVLPENAERFFESVMNFEGLRVSGLMTMGPVVATPEEIRPYFRITKQLFDSLSHKYGFGDDPILSMGMSDSYKVAIEEGSTLIRVGRRLFAK